MSTPPGDATLDYSLLDRAGVATQIFYPRADPGPPPVGASDHEIEVAPGVAIAARFYAAGESHPTVLYFHGNGEVVSDHDGIAHFYHKVGLNLLVAEFRGYGKSGGRPAVAALVSDAIPAVEYATALLAEGGYDPRMFVMGRSLGSQPALEVAARASAHVRGLIIESATASAAASSTALASQTTARRPRSPSRTRRRSARSACPRC